MSSTGKTIVKNTKPATNIISRATDHDVLMEAVRRFSFVPVKNKRVDNKLVGISPKTKESCPIYIHTEEVHSCDNDGNMCLHLVGTVEHDVIACAYNKNFERGFK
jgi:hypothetical protein